MQMTLVLVALSANALGVLFAAGLSRGAGTRALRGGGARAALVLAIVLTLLIYCAALPTNPPFAHGLALGWGALAGGVCGIIALLLLLAAQAGESSPTAGIVVLSTAGVAPSLLLLLFHPYPNPALTGCAVGGVTVASVCAGLLRLTRQDDASNAAVAHGMELFAVTLTAVCAGSLLAIAYFPGLTTGISAAGYWPLPELLVGGGALALLLCSGWQNHLVARLPWLPGAVAGVVMLLIVLALQMHLLPKLRWSISLISLLAFTGVLALLHSEERQATGRVAFRPLALSVGLLFVVLAVAALAFRLLHGYGEALAVLPAIAVVAAIAVPRPATETGPRVTPALGVGALVLLLVLLLTRTLLEGMGKGHALDFQWHYDAFSLLLGATGVVGMISFMQRGMPAPRMPGAATPVLLPVVRVLLSALLSVLTPLAILLAWGQNAVLALLLGLGVGVIIWMTLAVWLRGREHEQALAATPLLPILLAAVYAGAFAPFVLAWHVTRYDKLLIVLALAVLAIVLVLLDSVHAARNQQGDTADALE